MNTEQSMGMTIDSVQAIANRAKEDHDFARALLIEAKEMLTNGEEDAAKMLLQDLAAGF